MQHVHWWLFALSFFLGLALTFALLRKGAPTAEPETPTTKIVVAPAKEEPPTTKIPVAPKKEEPPTTKIPVAPTKEETPTTKIPTVPFAPYGAGSARAGADGAGPAGWLVKGRSDTRHYYTPDDAAYERTVAQVWFRDEETARRAYFTPGRKGSKK
ncbi:channel accessory protein ArfC, sunset domain variant [Mycobacterium conspicuum]|jgi:uncharacterized membrane protein ArfC|nr:hypothetical protein [Mycobacterium conspicuum]ORV45184.1 hypothetical protein AWC00_06315 [Mycobacterium conspicuum]